MHHGKVVAALMDLADSRYMVATVIPNDYFRCVIWPPTLPRAAAVTDLKSGEY